MLVADLQPRHPPVLHIGMIAVGDVDVPPAPQPAFIAMVEILQPVQIVQIPDDRCVFAVDLERVERLVSPRVSRRFERRQRAVTETARNRLASSIDRLRFAGQIVFALLMKVSVIAVTSSICPFSHMQYRCCAREDRR